MKSVLVFIDGTICDDRHRINLYGTKEFNSRYNVLRDKPVTGSVDFIKHLAESFKIIYMGARELSELDTTKEWLRKNNFPEGEVYLALTQRERMVIVRDSLMDKNIVLGIGDRWDDNQLHLELGCLSIIVKEYEGDWENISKYITAY